MYTTLKATKFMDPIDYPRSLYTILKTTKFIYTNKNSAPEGTTALNKCI